MGGLDRLTVIKKFYRKHKRLPSYSEMLKLFNISSKNAVFKIIGKWIEEGLLKKDGLRLAPTHKFFAIPLLGNIRAGFPILAEENRDYVSLDEYLIEDPQSSFLLKVNGDSLEGIGIFEGDIVIVERKKDAPIGSVVLAQIDKEWTLKILRKDRLQRIMYLSAANPRYPSFYPKDELQIFGIVKAVVRKFN
jgi:repressor LexA